MNLPDDLIANVFAYLRFEDIKMIGLDYNMFKKIIFHRTGKIYYEPWFWGMYNNLYYRCYKCGDNIDFNLHVMIFCMKCELEYDDTFRYPIICINCVDSKVCRGKITCTKCPSCDDNRMHIGITSYS